MPKILYLITQSELGGAQKNVLDLAVVLKDKYEILVAAGPDGGGQLFEATARLGLSCRRLKYLRRSAANPLADLAAIWEIRQLLKKFQPDILHSHSSKAGVLGSLAAWGLKTKVIYTVHGAVFTAAFSPLARWVFLWLEKLTAFLKDKIICVSQNDKDLWLKYKVAPPEKLIVIRNGLDSQKLDFLPKQIAREKLLSNIKQPISDIRIVGTIANFYPEKGLEYLVEAAKIILQKESASNILFLIIGEGVGRLAIEKQIKKSGLENNFILTGALPNAASYLPAFDLFILPSIKEGLPYTILEALAAGLPVVASAVGGVPEMIENNRNGFLVLPRDSRALAEKINELLKNPALTEQFAEASKTKLSEFSLQKMVAETEKIYQ